MGRCAYRTSDNGATFTGLGDAFHCDVVSVDLTDPERKTVVAGGHEQAGVFYQLDPSFKDRIDKSLASALTSVQDLMKWIEQEYGELASARGYALGTGIQAARYLNHAFELIESIAGSFLSVVCRVRREQNGPDPRL